MTQLLTDSKHSTASCHVITLLGVIKNVQSTQSKIINTPLSISDFLSEQSVG